MINPKLFGYIINMVYHGCYIACFTPKAGDATNANIAICISNGTYDVVRLSPEMMMKCSSRGVAGYHGLRRNLGSFQASLPARVGNVNDHSHLIHFSYHSPPKIT